MPLYSPALDVDAYPDIRPSLLLDFANSERVDPRITFTRSTTATRTNKNGQLEIAPAGTPRIDYDPITGKCKGLLIEEQRTNLLLNSEKFDLWTQNTGVTTTLNAATAPDGSTTADLITETIADSGVQQVVALAPGATYAASCYFAAGSAGTIRFRDGADNHHIDISTSTWTITATSAVTASGIENVGGGWYRAWFTFVAVGASSSINPRTTNGTGTFYAWGAQLEADVLASSYIPTTTAAVTRSADVALMTGDNFSSWYRPDEWTLVAHTTPIFASLLRPAGERLMTQITDGTNANKYGIRYVSNPAAPQLDASGVTSSSAVFDFGGIGVSGGVTNRAALAVRLNDIALSINGGPVESDTAAAITTTVNQMQISIPNGGAGYISALAFYPARLANSELQALTA